MPNKFNDANGSPEQQTCQSSCTRTDSRTGVVGRLNNNGDSFDVLYSINSNGDEYVCCGADKCFNCPDFISHFGL